MSAFDSHYASIYLARWPSLRSALLSPATKVTRSCFEGHADYILDAASIRAAEALQVQTGETVLDLCAAPGGKALILAEALRGTGRLVANELSSSRRMRLKEVLSQHVPAQYQANLQITGFDGNQFGLKKPGEFDRILLDAPCSSEQHLLQDDPDQKAWKISRTKQLAQRQYSLLCSALLALKPGGQLVYSTCSISPLENDGVVGRLLERKSDQVGLNLRAPEFADLEATEFGYQLFPDLYSGIGPIYFSRLTKKN